MWGWYLSRVDVLRELLVLLLLGAFLALAVVLVLRLGPIGVGLDLAYLTSLVVLGAMAIPHTPLDWDLPHLLPDRAWFRVMEARHNHGWGGPWGGHDWPV